MFSFTKNRYIYTLIFAFITLNAYLFYNEIYYLIAIPFAFAIVYSALFALDKLLLFTIFCTPLSFNLEQLDVGGVGVYLPTEPILFGIMIIYLFKSIINKKELSNPVLKHPITIAILFHLFWVFITSITSEIPIVSFKFLLTRMWFIIPIYFLGIKLFKYNFKNVTNFIWVYIIPLSFVLIITLIRHAGYGFSEEAGHWIMTPFFKDHTSYGAIIAMFYPVIVGLFFDKNRTQVSRTILGIMLIIFTIALYYSYTRAAWLSVVGAFGVYMLFVLKIKFKYLVYVVVILGSFIVFNFTEITYMLQKNDAEHTTEDFGERIKSMSNVTSDASNLERLNRWNSAIEMFKERPIFGWGPGVYSFQYAPFQSSSDLTIISTNFGTGGNAHSEYLGPLAEQGFLGFLSMIILVIAIFYTSSKLYIELKDKKTKKIIMMVMLGLVTYFTHGILNNYLDTDKASVAVWGFTAIIVGIDIYHKNNREETNNGKS